MDQSTVMENKTMNHNVKLEIVGIIKQPLQIKNAENSKVIVLLDQEEVVLIIK